MSARAVLKAATQAAHDRVDALFASYDLSEAGDYAQFLTAHASALLPVEQALESAGAAKLIEGWSEHRRSELIRLDLAALGLSLPETVAAPDYPDEAGIWGGAYVLEGSRLGAAVLVKGVGNGLPCNFLNAPAAPGRWRRFTASLERYLATHVERSRAGRAALDTFTCFETAAGAARYHS